MPEPDDKHEQLIEAARTEISEMTKEGFDHPSAKPVLIGAVIGAVAGALVLHGGGWVVGLLVGAGMALYLRIKDRDR
jgi:hypothetical protein